eukprot:TRINITY_DN3253_c0_g1_i1.p1 TRINITY_DN3253_c0_g1~~TRINITY_DN3253_c0_g1_i1.p1  ORF type:complete len:313 (+),score=69.46 TRINITY_DN3253_c0_g1_i1:79-1017(+)
MSKMLLRLLFVWIGLAPAEEACSQSDIYAPSLMLDDACLNSLALEDACALNALQTAKSTSASFFGDERVLEAAGDPWKKQDISSDMMKRMRHEAQEFQAQVAELWNGTARLMQATQRMVAQVETATGSDVDKPSLETLIQVEGSSHATTGTSRSFAGRRRGKSTGIKTLPKRTKYVMRLFIYLQKELISVKSELTKIARLRNAVNNVLISMPHGPRQRIGSVSLQEEGIHPKKEEKNPDGIPLGESHRHMVKRVSKEIIADIKGTGKNIDFAARQVRETQLKVDAWILEGSKKGKKGKGKGTGKHIVTPPAV